MSFWDFWNLSTQEQARVYSSLATLVKETPSLGVLSTEQLLGLALDKLFP